MEAIIQASNCPEYIKNAWLYLDKGLLELSTTYNTLTTFTEAKFFDKLSAIEK